MLQKVVDAGEGQISAGRFVLRPVQASDAALITTYAGDYRVASGTRTIPHPLPEGVVDALIVRATAADRLEDVWVMDGSGSGMAEVLGAIALKRMDRAQSEIGYWVAPEYWNSGLASDAVRALVAANPQACRTIFAEVFQDNLGSARVLTNAGFQYLGDAEAFSIARNACVPTWTYVKRVD